MPCNWKLSVDNVWDWYHANISHASAFQSGYGVPRPGTKGGAAVPDTKEPPINRLAWKQVVALGEYGHAISGPWYRKENPGQMAMIDESWREPAGDEGAPRPGRPQVPRPPEHLPDDVDHR